MPNAHVKLQEIFFKCLYIRISGRIPEEILSPVELEKEKIGLNRYADKHPGIKLIGYDASNYDLTEHFSFFGQYIELNILAKAKGYRLRWKFIFKVHSTGTILGEIVVCANGELI